jgi:hypothetical protein
MKTHESPRLQHAAWTKSAGEILEKVARAKC